MSTNVENKKSSLNHPVHQYYQYSATLNKSKCNECGESKTGKHSSNLLRHLKARHNRLYKDILPDCAQFVLKRKTPNQNHGQIERKKITVSYDLDDLTKSLACWITVDARPYSIVDDAGTRLESRFA